MKNHDFSTYLLLLFCLVSCKKDCQTFETYQVDFYIDHEEFQLIGPVFETVSEQVLIKEASFSNGTVFKTLSEQVLALEAFTQRSIYKKQDISIIINTETNTIKNLSCYDFFESDEFEEEVIPNQYTSRTYQVVDKQGTGIEVPAEYETRTFIRVVSDSKIETLSRERRFERLTFTIPDQMKIEEYLQDQMAQQSILNCIENISYRIVK